ncbi:NAD(P)/FAD-dependent oxidoreductase [Halanaerobium hydrogeniformans]|uniref:HI0933 family protein n=1 Tax=Halanaerobium hydrogeniformans TaxID=656519 RepID=E4RKR3_HALHG|nr:NAD(P)/FAD-dependent oxidoreductase [Halanaerobium hydrogeniformans]ADQ14733.1 HI0933 family protein [Halanaerobium hydrogeniformans]
MQKVLIIGGGPAGMIAAIEAAANDNDVYIIERNKRLGKKLLITGKGRCNISNYSAINEHIDNIVDNPKFLYSLLAEFDAYRLFSYFSQLGLELEIQRGNRIFPRSKRASDVLRVLKKELLNKDVKIIQDFVQEVIIEDEKAVGVKLKYGDILKGDRIILATGGCSYPETGSDGSGFKLAEKCGHNIVEPSPGLTALICEEKWIYEAQGLKLRNTGLEVYNNKGQKIYSDFGELEIRDGYLDGPMIISASMMLDFKKESSYQLKLDLKPALDYETLDQRILRDFAKYNNKYFANSLDDLLPIKLRSVFIKLSSIDYDKTVNQITAEERQELLKLFKELSLTITAKKGFKRAIVTRGGVDTDQIDPNTLESKVIENLYFAGEIMDVAAMTGGYNLQIAFSSGYKAGNSV